VRRGRYELALKGQEVEEGALRESFWALSVEVFKERSGGGKQEEKRKGGST